MANIKPIPPDRLSSKFAPKTPDMKRERRREGMLRSAQAGAKKSGRAVTIGVNDIPMPTHCIYLGVQLVYSGGGPNAATLNRIDNRRGFVPGNIQVISRLASMMKTNATIEQMVAFAKAVLRVHAQPSEAGGGEGQGS